MLQLRRALLAVAFFAPLAGAQSDPAETPERSALRVLLVGHDPANPRVVFPQLAKPRTHELYRERTAAWHSLLREHFEDVTLVHAAKYRPAMSQRVDVTVFDAQPPLGPGRLSMPLLPSDFDRPALLIAENSPGIGEPLGLKLDWL